jgi:hypothetical protein
MVDKKKEESHLQVIEAEKREKGKRKKEKGKRKGKHLDDEY